MYFDHFPSTTLHERDSASSFFADGFFANDVESSDNNLSAQILVDECAPVFYPPVPVARKRSRVCNEEASLVSQWPEEHRPAESIYLSQQSDRDEDSSEDINPAIAYVTRCAPPCLESPLTMQDSPLVEPGEKRIPTSKKAVQMHRQRDLYTQYHSMLPLLTMRPYLKDVNAHFCHSVHIIDACLVHLVVKNEQNSWVQTLAERDFMKARIIFNQLWATMSCAVQKPWFYALTTLEERNNEPFALYYDTDRRVMYVIDINNNHNAALTVAKIRSMFPKMNANVRVEIKHIPFLVQNHPKRVGGIVSATTLFEMSPICRKKFWYALAVLLTMARRCCPLVVFAELQQAADPLGLLHLFVQSILYYVVDHESSVVACAIENTTRHASHIRKLVASLHDQCNTKPTLSTKKLHTNRIGKFKGRQTDHLFCLVLNQVVGIYASYENLLKYNLFFLLTQAALFPNESEFDYDDLHAKLPMLFPKTQANLFSSGFQLRTDFLTSRDPLVCFGPVAGLFWPQARSAKELVAANGKKWKLEITIESQPVQETHALQRFIECLELGPINAHCVLSEWVSIVDQRDMPYHIYYRDPSRSLEYAAEQLDHYPGFEVTEYQKPIRIEHETGIYKLRFLRDPFHGLWKGSRSTGIAVRRFYKNKTFFIRTFANVEKLRDDCKTHCFLLGDNTPFHVPQWNLQTSSVRVLNIDTVEELFRPGKFVLLDDIGKPRFVLVGHQPLACFQECTHCNVFPNDHTWMTQLKHVHTAPYDGSKELTKDVDRLEYMVHCGENERIVVRDTNTSPLQDRIRRVLGNVHYSTYWIGAIRGSQVTYCDSFGELQQKVQHVCLGYATSLGVSSFRYVSPTLYEARIPSGCVNCCRTSLCLRALAAALLLVSLACHVKVVASTIPIVCGKLLKTDTLQLRVGLRCKHNWTQGVPNLFFETIVLNSMHNVGALDIIVCHHDDVVTPNGQRVLRLL